MAVSLPVPFLDTFHLHYVLPAEKLHVSAPAANPWTALALLLRPAIGMEGLVALTQVERPGLFFSPLMWPCLVIVLHYSCFSTYMQTFT